MLLNWFRKSKENTKEADEFVYDQAVLLEIDLEGLEDLGSKADHDAIDKLEAQIALKLPLRSGIDGDEYGENSCTIYIYGPSADEIFEEIKDVLKYSQYNHIMVTLQYGLPDDPKTKEKKFSL